MIWNRYSVQYAGYLFCSITGKYCITGWMGYFREVLHKKL